ncbi:hypothetical protein NDU88_005035 [Pleurodeles waltl]|uniref:Uncharacterized protein n=1 Tax=Pleurodeles waltl TaxID=8319 RepID=A0AAV7V6U9_PLEWA|nr:hypothetical protein NDU88_005035 [Pleurodeles waltl]
MAAGSCSVQEMSHVKLLDTGCLRHQIWTTGPLGSLGHFGPPLVLQEASSSSGEESQSIGCCHEGCLLKQESYFVTPQKIPLVLLVQGEDWQSSERVHLGNCCKSWLERKLQVTGVVLDTLVQLQWFLEQSTVAPTVIS